jgi:hypothetical protein
MFSCFLIGFEPVLIMFTRVCQHISICGSVNVPLPRYAYCKIEKVIFSDVK